jgi:hypothetical protein
VPLAAGTAASADAATLAGPTTPTAASALAAFSNVRRPIAADSVRASTSPLLIIVPALVIGSRQSTVGQ